MAKKVAGQPAVDVTMPDVSIRLKGETYYLAFTYGALSTAERKLAAVGQKVDMFEVVDFSRLNASALEIMLFAALQAQHPDITFDQVKALLTIKNFGRVHEALVKAYTSAMSEPDEDAPKNPPEGEPAE